MIFWELGVFLGKTKNTKNKQCTQRTLERKLRERLRESKGNEELTKGN
jgi:hypothetical protein